MKAVHAKGRPEVGSRTESVCDASRARPKQAGIVADRPLPGVLSSPLWRFLQRPGNASTSSGS
jgi:hypothetical protein